MKRTAATVALVFLLLLIAATWSALRDRPPEETAPPTTGTVAQPPREGEVQRERVRVAQQTAPSTAGTLDREKRPGTLLVRVVDSAGSPVGDAQVHAHRQLAGYLDETAVAQGVTNHDGRATLRLDLAPKVALVAWTASRASITRFGVEGSVSEPQEIEVVLLDAYTLSGRVLDESGRPIAGASVFLTDFGNAGVPSTTRRTRSGEHGRFTFVPYPVPSRGEVELRISANGYLDWPHSAPVTAGGGTSVEARLTPGVRLQIKGLDEYGQPVGEYSVLAGAGGARVLGHADELGAFDVTFALDEIVSPLTLRAGGFAVRVLTLRDVRTGTLDLGAVRFGEGLPLAGRLLLPAGETRRYRVAVRTSEHGIPVGTARSAEDGSFRVTGVGPKLHEIRVQREVGPGELTIIVPRVLARARGGDDDLSIPVPLAPRLTVRFRDAKGLDALPVSAAWVEVRRSGGEIVLETDLSPRGRVTHATVEVDEPGEFDVTIEVPGYDVVRLVEQPIHGAAGELEVRLVEQGD